MGGLQLCLYIISEMYDLKCSVSASSVYVALRSAPGTLMRNVSARSDQPDRHRIGGNRHESA